MWFEGDLIFFLTETVLGGNKSDFPPLEGKKTPNPSLYKDA